MKEAAKKNAAETLQRLLNDAITFHHPMPTNNGRHHKFVVDPLFGQNNGGDFRVSLWETTPQGDLIWVVATALSRINARDLDYSAFGGVNNHAQFADGCWMHIFGWEKVVVWEIRAPKEPFNECPIRGVDVIPANTFLAKLQNGGMVFLNQE